MPQQALKMGYFYWLLLVNNSNHLPGFLPFFQEQISRTFQELFQDPKISMSVTHFLFLTRVLRISFFQHFPVLENGTTNFQDFPGFPGPV